MVEFADIGSLFSTIFYHSPSSMGCSTLLASRCTRLPSILGRRPRGELFPSSPGQRMHDVHVFEAIDLRALGSTLFTRGLRAAGRTAVCQHGVVRFPTICP